MSDEAEEIFAEALEVDSSRREEFLADACHGDKELLSEVEGLLRDAAGADTFFESLTRGAPGVPGSRGCSADKEGMQIGPYTLVRLLGRGGFGAVWLAGQTQPIRRHVALKLIKRGMDSEDVLARFRAEQQALAIMDHPNIARVFEAGSTHDGRPYFAMEMVEGQKITEFCDKHNLSIPERLRLFLQVCAAVNHAHQKGVIHRDLKPSNILVTGGDGAPAVKVIDFGIARAIEGSLAGDIDVTRADQFVGTPSYMSPEQAGGNRSGIDTRTDVYSLGVILYELLVGTVPFDEKTLVAAGRDEIRRIIREEEPARPSTKLLELPADERTCVATARKASGDTLPRMVGAELDWIAMKAIEKSKDRRYETADALGKDVQRFLDNEPVSARPPSAFYLLGKAARRHRVLLAAVAAIAAILVAATATSVWLALRARKAERLADARLAQVLDEQAAREKALLDAEAVSNFIANVFRSPDPDRDGRKVTAAEVLAGAEKEIPAKLVGQPARQILLKRTLADTYTGLGLYQDAIRLRKEVLEEDGKVAGEGSPETLDDMSRLAQMLLQLGYYADALELFRCEVESRKAQSPPDPAKLDTAEAGLTECLYRTGQRDEAEKLRNATRPAQTPAAPSPAPTPEPQGAAGEALRKQKAENILQGLRELSASLPPQDPKLLHAMREASEALYWIGEKNSAISIQKDLTGRLEDKFGPDHMVTIEEEDFLAFLYWRNGPMRESEPLRRNLIERRRKLFGPEHLETLDAEARYAQSRFFGGHLGEAMQSLERVVPLLRKVAGPDHEATNDAASNLARCYCTASRTPEAIALLKDCAPKLRDDSFIASLLAGLLVWQGRDEEYRAHRDAVLEWAWENRNSMRTRPDIYERLVFMSCYKPLENEEQRQQVREIIRLAALQRAAVPLKELKESCGQQLCYGVVAYRLGDFDEARRYLEKSLAFDQGRFPDSANCRAAGIYLAMTRAAQGDKSAADYYTDHRKTIPDPPSDDHPLANWFAGDGDRLVPWIARREADKIFGR